MCMAMQWKGLVVEMMESENIIWFGHGFLFVLPEGWHGVGGIYWKTRQEVYWNDSGGYGHSDSRMVLGIINWLGLCPCLVSKAIVVVAKIVLEDMVQVNTISQWWWCPMLHAMGAVQCVVCITSVWIVPLVSLTPIVYCSCCCWGVGNKVLMKAKFVWREAGHGGKVLECDDGALCWI